MGHPSVPLSAMPVSTSEPTAAPDGSPSAPLSAVPLSTREPTVALDLDGNPLEGVPLSTAASQEDDSQGKLATSIQLCLNPEDQRVHQCLGALPSQQRLQTKIHHSNISTRCNKRATAIQISCATDENPHKEVVPLSIATAGNQTVQAVYDRLEDDYEAAFSTQGDELSTRLNTTTRSSEGSVCWSY
jgi:hypothetical protein